MLLTRVVLLGFKVILTDQDMSLLSDPFLKVIRQVLLMFRKLNKTKQNKTKQTNKKNIIVIHQFLCSVNNTSSACYHKHMSQFT